MFLLEKQPRTPAPGGPRGIKRTGMPRFDRRARRRAARNGGAKDARYLGRDKVRASLLVALAGLGIAMIAYPYREPTPAPSAYTGPAPFLLTIRYTSIVHEYGDWKSCSIAASFVEANPAAVPDGMTRDVTCEEVQ